MRFCSQHGHVSTACENCKNTLEPSDAHLIAASTGAFGIIRFIHTVRRASGNAARSRLQLASSRACLRKRWLSSLNKCKSICDTFRSPTTHGQQGVDTQLCSPCQSEIRDRYCVCDMRVVKRCAVNNAQHEPVSFPRIRPRTYRSTQNAARCKCWKIQLSDATIY